MGDVSTTLMDRLAERQAEGSKSAAHRTLEENGLDGLTELARRVHGCERDELIRRLFEMLQELLGERGVDPIGRCRICGYTWEPGGAYEAISIPVKEDGTLCAMADRLNGLVIKVPRPQLLECPQCVEDYSAEAYGCMFGFHEADGCVGGADCPNG